MMEAMQAGAQAGAWIVGWTSVVFVGMTLLAALVRVGRWITRR